MEDVTDAMLLIQLREDAHGAFDLLFERYWEKMYRVAKARVNDEEAAKDLLQEVFIKLWQRRRSIEVQLSLEQYLYGAVRLSVISYFRSRKATEQQLLDAVQRITLLEDSISDNAGYLELEKTLEDAVNNMPEMLQRVYQLRSDNYSVKSIAEELGLAEQTVKNYISEVLRRLRIVIINKYPDKHITYLAVLAVMLHK